MAVVIWMLTKRQLLTASRLEAIMVKYFRVRAWTPGDGQNLGFARIAVDFAEQRFLFPDQRRQPIPD